MKVDEKGNHSQRLNSINLDDQETPTLATVVFQIVIDEVVVTSVTFFFFFFFFVGWGGGGGGVMSYHP